MRQDAVQSYTTRYHGGPSVAPGATGGEVACGLMNHIRKHPSKANFWLVRYMLGTHQ